MKALVLERKGELSLRDIDLPLEVGPDDVKIAIHTVGICGSDIHYYTHGRIGRYVVDAPMVLGHEAAGTPPVHGVLTPHAVHPASFTYKLPDNVSFAEGAMVEPFAIGLQAATRARIAPGDVAAVVGAGPIGIMVALAARAAGCSRVFISDLSQEKLAIAGRYPGITPVHVPTHTLDAVVARETAGWGADVVFEASGSPRAFDTIFDVVRPGGALVLVGLPVSPVGLDISAAISKEVRIETVFRYANVFERAIDLIASGKVDLKPLVTKTFTFNDSIRAFERAASGLPSIVKLQITLPDQQH
jgi:D-xylulose reductase